MASMTVKMEALMEQLQMSGGGHVPGALTRVNHSLNRPMIQLYFYLFVNCQIMGHNSSPQKDITEGDRSSISVPDIHHRKRGY